MEDTIKGEAIRFSDDYLAVWNEAQNIETRDIIRSRLERSIATTVVFQPGDGTRYRFLLTPEPREFTVTNNGVEAVDRMSQGSLLVTVLDGLGEGTTSIARHNGYEGIKYRILDKMKIGNVCTIEALARTVEALWFHEEQ